MNLIPSVSPIAAGGACFLDPSSARGAFIDTGIDNDEYKPYGRVCLSVTTVEHLARLIGWAPADEVEALHEELEVTKAALETAERKASEWGNVIEFLGEAAAELADAGAS